VVTLADVNEQLDTVTFVETAPGTFRVEGRIPNWIFAFCPGLTSDGQIKLAESFIFLGGFIEQAHEEHDSQGSDRIGSGPWTERDQNDIEQNLSALAVFVKGSLIIQVSLIPDELRYHQRIFQKAREYSLEFEQSRRDKEQREVLLHAIVHDLSRPLTTIDGALHVLEDKKLAQVERDKLESLMESQIASAQEMVNSILEIFQSDHQVFQAGAVTEDNAPVALVCVETAVTNFAPIFRQENVNLVVTKRLRNPKQKVVAEEDQLQRVFSNLLENALRFSPKGSTVTVLLEEDAAQRLIITVTDQGPGVPEGMTESLFQRFSGGKDYGGRGGLGLYYCHMCIERWGGDISYIAPQHRQSSPGARDGASFRIELSKFDLPGAGNEVNNLVPFPRPE